MGINGSHDLLRVGSISAATYALAARSTSSTRRGSAFSPARVPVLLEHRRARSVLALSVIGLVPPGSSFAMLRGGRSTARPAAAVPASGPLRGTTAPGAAPADTSSVSMIEPGSEVCGETGEAQG
ncbi:hypothetical protein LQL77_30725 [Rhodococcus cerastii]|nr:hypothetical protein [Rhodococcus cerastii]